MIISSENENSCIFFFPICISVTSFSYLTTLARTSSMIFKKTGEGEHPALALISLHKKALRILSLSMMLAVDFFVDILHQGEESSFLFPLC